MRLTALLFVFLLSFSCSNEKELQLAKITHSEITKITDVSPAYIFYNPSEPDSLELNRKNLISTTNWLVNIDKRLTLKQLISTLMFLQEKKENASHKNKSSKNYFTGFNPKDKTLRFLDFTTTRFHLDTTAESYKKDHNPEAEIINISENTIQISNKNYTESELINALNSSTEKDLKYILNFHSRLTFQEYLKFKDALLSVKHSSVFIDQNEFIY
ncbi:hypothetical protein [Formosa sp. S-31]|uniref:hypothetical protein n=1 Tax=Formosa sp. S-31 TaxID=2790949 RepID=UPI003EB89046